MRLRHACLLFLLCCPCFAQAEVPVPADPQDATPELAVRQLYRDYVWEVLFDTTEAHWETLGLVYQPRMTLVQYFSLPLIQLLARERSCRLSSHRPSCNLDFDPIWEGWQAGSVLRVERGNELNTVRVIFSDAEGDQDELLYQLVMGSRGYVIADVQYPHKGSLRALLLRSDDKPAIGVAKPAAR
jgi:hypothetical protein